MKQSARLEKENNELVLINLRLSDLVKILKRQAALDELKVKKLSQKIEELERIFLG